MGLPWKTFKGFSRYKVFSNGKIFDIKRNVYVAQTLNREGYLKVTLRRDDGVRKTFSVHRVVAICYIPNPKKLPEVNHRDGIKKHCYERNLEWINHAGNIQHAWDTKLLVNTKERSNNLSKALKGKNTRNTNGNSSAVFCITTKEKFECVVDAVKKYGVSQPQLTKCCTGYRGAKSAGKHPVTGEPLRWRYQ